jgi:hypothetical protein
MAGFFNKKEEVIYFEFTPYGRRAVTRGRFKPEFYSFHDGDILYDGDCAGIAEVQNQVKGRIKDSPRLKFTIPAKAETDKDKELQDGPMPNLQLGNLGKSLSRNTAPTFQAVFLDGKITSYTASYTEATGSEYKIPQLGIDYIVHQSTDVTNAVVEEQYDAITLYLAEYNSPTSKGNFEYEVYQKEENGTFIKVESDGGLYIILDEDIGDYDELIEDVDAAKGVDDNRMAWVKTLKKASGRSQQDRGNIYDIDDPGEVCD